MKKIKIIHIIGQLGYGGAETLLLDLCRKIDKDLFEVSVLSLTSDGPLLTKFEQADVKVKFLYKRFKGDLRIVRQAKKYLLTEKPDIVHTHLFVGDFYGGLAALLAKVPVIVSTKHDVLNLGKVKNFLSSLIRKRFAMTIAISEATRHHLIKTEKIPFEKVQMVYNGIDIARFFVAEPKLFKQEMITIGAIGRLSKEKGHKHLIRACRFLKAQNWKLILVGDGPLRNELERSVQMLGLEDKVAFVGEVADVRPFLEKIDIFVLPSVSEGLSLALIEAGLAGRFVIATDVGGVPEIIEDRKTGLLFKSKNIEQLVKQLNWAFDHQDDARDMALKLQKQATERFDINNIIIQYQRLYLDLLK